MDIRISYIVVVKEGAPLQALVKALNARYGDSIEEESFEEHLVFKPYNEAGNMNYVIRDTSVSILYSTRTPNTCSVTYYGAPVDNPYLLKFPYLTALSARTSDADCNFRSILVKSGFQKKADFAKKGITFSTRVNNQKIVLSRPYNAILSIDNLKTNGVASWHNIPGSFPFKQDYLLEIHQNIKSVEEVETACDSLSNLVNSILVKD